VLKKQNLSQESTKEIFLTNINIAETPINTKITNSLCSATYICWCVRCAPAISNLSISPACRGTEQQLCSGRFAAEGPCWDRRMDTVWPYHYIDPVPHTMQAVPKARFGLVFLPPLVLKKIISQGPILMTPWTTPYTVDERTLKLKRNCSKFLFLWGEILNPYGVRVSVESVDLNCDLSVRSS